MSQNQPDIAVPVGRFQPFHSAHLALLRRALDVAPRVVVVIGSAHPARTPKNPFTWSDRAVSSSSARRPISRPCASSPKRLTSSCSQTRCSVRCAPAPCSITPIAACVVLDHFLGLTREGLAT